MFDEDQLPPSPRRITEISFTSFPQKLEALEKLDDGRDKILKGKIFWLRITRDMTKINEMQNVFKYLRYAELVPAIKRIQVRCFFQKWKQAFTAKKWIDIARKVRFHTKMTEFQSNADRIVKVRVKFAKNGYLKNHQFVPDFSFLSASATSKRITPLQDLMPIVLPPPKEEYEYEEDEEEAEAEIEEEELNDDTKQPISPSPTKNDAQPLSTRAIEVEEEEDIIDDVIDQNEEEQQNENKEEEQNESKEEPIVSTETKQNKRKFFIILLGVLVTALIAAFFFFQQSKPLKPLDHPTPSDQPPLPSPPSPEPTPTLDLEPAPTPQAEL